MDSKGRSRRSHKDEKKGGKRTTSNDNEREKASRDKPKTKVRSKDKERDKKTSQPDVKKSSSKSKTHSDEPPKQESDKHKSRKSNGKEERKASKEERKSRKQNGASASQISKNGETTVDKGNLESSSNKNISKSSSRISKSSSRISSKDSAEVKKKDRHKSTPSTDDKHKDQDTKSREVEKRKEAMVNAIESNKSIEAEEDYDYDDDFEDYDDDGFESEPDEDSHNSSSSQYSDSDSISEDSRSNHGISEAERRQIKEAMALENSRVGSSSSLVLPSSPTNTPLPGSPATDVRNKSKARRSARGLDFAAAQKNQSAMKALSKTAQRGKDLLRLLELDTIDIDLLELKPQTEYELYMKSFSRSETYQKSTQYNEDYLDKETSTEPSDTKTCWTQHPMELASASAHEGETADEEVNVLLYNPITLNKFIAISSEIVCRVLEERASRHGYTQTFQPNTTSTFSNTTAHFPPSQIAASRSPIHITAISAQTFVVSYTQAKGAGPVSSPGLSCVWNLQDVHTPVSVLVSNAPHRCACVSAYNHSIVFVGSEDGSISLWDLNESDSMHNPRKKLNSVLTRLPTYSSCGIHVAESHNSKITSLQAIQFDQEKQQMASFQIASLDEHGVLVVWVVVPVIESSFSGSQTDLGLRPGGKIKLVKSASINVNFPLHMNCFPEIRTYAFKQSYTDPSLYFVATDKGAILKASRNQSIAQPSYYCEEHSVPSIIGAMDFNHFNWKYLLCGASDGSVSLYYVSRDSPLVVWDRATRGRPVRSLAWSRVSSTIFYVMDSANKFYMWDLSVRDSTPLITQNFDGKGLLSFTELLPSSPCPILVLGFKDGSLEAHRVKEEALNSSVNNITKLEKYLSSVL